MDAHFVKPNHASPYYPELSGLLLKALGPLNVLSERLRRVAGIEDAYLFGSWARRYQGEAGPPPGDIDVVVIGDPDVDDIYDACSDVSRDLAQDVNPVILTPEEWRSKRSGFIRQVRSGPLVALTSTWPMARPTLAELARDGRIERVPHRTSEGSIGCDRSGTAASATINRSPPVS